MMKARRSKRGKVHAVTVADKKGAFIRVLCGADHKDMGLVEPWEFVSCRICTGILSGQIRLG